MTWWDLVVVDKVPSVVLLHLGNFLSHCLRLLRSVYYAHCSVVGLRLFNVKLSRENGLGLVSYFGLGDEPGCQNFQGVFFRGIWCVDVIFILVNCGSS